MNRMLIFVLMSFSVALAQAPDRPLAVNLSAGYAGFAPTDLNNYIKTAFPEIRGGMTALADVGYHIMPQLSLHAGVGYLSAASKGRLGVTNETGPTVLASAEETYSITSFPVYLGVRYHFVDDDPFTLAAGAFGEIHPTSVKYKLEATAYSQGAEESRSKTAFGARFSIVPEYSFTQRLAVWVNLDTALLRLAILVVHKDFCLLNSPSTRAGLLQWLAWLYDFESHNSLTLPQQ